MLFPGGTVVKNLPANAGNTGDRGFNPWVGKSPWRKKWQPIPVLLPGKSHGQRSLAGNNPCGHRELDMTGVTSYTHTYIYRNDLYRHIYRNDYHSKC